MLASITSAMPRGVATSSSTSMRFMSAAATTIGVPPPPTASGASQVGILAMDAYFPQRCVDMNHLEEADGVAPGKYTKGLGQHAMAFVDDREDINSICLSAVDNLLRKYDISPDSVGRLEVGTESLIDKSKSSKTTLMSLFPDNNDMEGATCMNACYGGTAALLNSIAWVESSEWDGRYAVVVAADIASYEAGPARPTGGAGAVACLVGPDAPLKLVPRTRSSHAADVYDFYKPVLTSEYPTVDGKLSQACYLRAVDDCYSRNMRKLEALTHGPHAHADDTMCLHEAYDHIVFHSPYNKLVQHSFNRLIYNDARRFIRRGLPLPEYLAPLAAFADLPEEDTYFNRDLDKTLRSLDTSYDAMVGPSTPVSQSIGNTYTASVFMNLLSLVSQQRGNLVDKRVGVFSYGSGAIATMYAVEGAETGNRFSLDRIADTSDCEARLASRRRAPVDEFLEAMRLREETYGRADIKPTGSVDNLPAGAHFLEQVQANHNRLYDRLA